VLPLALFGLEADSLPVMIAVVALCVSAYGAVQARRSARAAEQSESHARRSADAAELNTDMQARSLELKKQQNAREEVLRAEERAPRWEQIADDETGYFVWHRGEFEGRLVNTGLSPAAVDLVVLDTPDGQRHPLQTRCEPPGPGSGGWESHPIISPGSVLALAPAAI
jgi:hypothetical protein